MFGHRASVQVQELRSLSELEVECKADFYSKFRRESCALISIYDVGAEYSGVVVGAPLNFAVCAIKDLLRVESDALRWTSSLPFDEEMWLEIKSAFERDGACVENISPLILVGLVTRPYMVKSNYKVISGSKGFGLDGNRFVFQTFPSELKDRVVEFYKDAISQFGEYSFIRAEESSENDVIGSRNESLEMRLSYLLGSATFRRGWAEVEKDKIRGALKQAISCIESGGELPWTISYEEVACPPFLGPFGSRNERPMHEWWGRVEFEIFALRCRLINKLGWPQMFCKIAAHFDHENGDWGLSEKFLDSDQRDRVGNVIRTMDLPYDPISELDSYISTMTRRYPVLLESPY